MAVVQKVVEARLVFELPKSGYAAALDRSSDLLFHIRLLYHRCVADGALHQDTVGSPPLHSFISSSTIEQRRDHT